MSFCFYLQSIFSLLIFPIQWNNRICWTSKDPVEIFKDELMLSLKHWFTNADLSLEEQRRLWARLVGRKRIYWPLRQLRCTSRSLALFLGRSLPPNRRDLCVSLSIGWQLWATHSSIDLHGLQFWRSKSRSFILAFSFFLNLDILEMRPTKITRKRTDAESHIVCGNLMLSLYQQPV